MDDDCYIVKVEHDEGTEQLAVMAKENALLRQEIEKLKNRLASNEQRPTQAISREGAIIGVSQP